LNTTIRLVRRDDVAEGTAAFTFSRPPGFEFRAGQAIDLTLIDPPETDAEGNVRTFTIASAPFEDHLMVATRMRDTAFKRVLRSAASGFELKLDGPSGSFNLHRNAVKPAVFLAGGIGVTPFRSIARQARKDGLPRRLFLFYSNRRPEDSAFLDELEETSGGEPSFHLIPTMTAMESSRRPWTGERGLIDRAMLLRHVPELQGPIYYLAGPPAMVAAMRAMLVAAAVDEDDIRTEGFSGY
jgi:ferredoxin-NADP reductase